MPRAAFLRRSKTDCARDGISFFLQHRSSHHQHCTCALVSILAIERARAKAPAGCFCSNSEIAAAISVNPKDLAAALRPNAGGIRGRPTRSLLISSKTNSSAMQFNTENFAHVQFIYPGNISNLSK